MLFRFWQAWLWTMTMSSTRTPPMARQYRPGSMVRQSPTTSSGPAAVQKRRFMHVQANAMPRTVGHRTIIQGNLLSATRSCILGQPDRPSPLREPLAGHPGSTRRDRGALGRHHRLMHPHDLVGDLSVNDGPRAVAVIERLTVAGENVDDDRLAGPQRSRTMIVAVGAGRPSGDDRYRVLITAPEQPDIDPLAQVLRSQYLTLPAQDPIAVSGRASDRFAGHRDGLLGDRLCFLEPNDLLLVFWRLSSTPHSGSQPPSGRPAASGERTAGAGCGRR
jgi:hypothetical protein